MSTFSRFLAEQGGLLLAAATCLLAIGCLGMALHRSPIHRQRAGEMAILGVLVWVVLACLPLPRYRLWDVRPAAAVGPDNRRLAEAVDDPPPTFQPPAGPILAEVPEEALPPMPADLLLPEVDIPAENGGAAPPAFRQLPIPSAVVEPEPMPTARAVQPPPDDDGRRVPVHRSPSVGPAFEVRRWASSAYVAGGLACLVWLALGRLLLVRMLWSARPPEPWLREVYQRLPFGRRRPRLLISERCTRALSFGVWRPTIVLPAGACRADCAGALRHVLLHELAHARQRDGWGHLLFNVAFPLLYFHPLYWWIRSRAYLAAELVADDWAAGRTAKESYVEALIALAKGGGRAPFAYLGSPQIFGSRSQFYRRMQMLLDRKARLARRCSPRWRVIYPAGCLVAVAVTAGAVGMRPAQAQSGEAATPSAEAVATPAPPHAQPPEGLSPAAPEMKSAPEEALVVGASTGEKSARPAKQDLVQAERDQLRKQLADLAAVVAELKREVEALKAGWAPAQASALTTPGRVPETMPPHEGTVTVRRSVSRPKELLMSVLGQPRPAQPAPAPSAPPVTPGVPVPPTQPTPPGGALPSSLAPIAGAARAGAPPSPPLPGAPTTIAVQPRSTTGRLAAALGGGAEGRPIEGTSIDLVRLATSYADAVGELELAKLECESRKELADRNAVSKHELAIAEIRLNVAQRKVALLRSIAESALAETKAEMDAAKGRLESVAKERPNDRSGVRAAEAQVIRAESRLRVLESILASAGR
jgi:beta-lactamase regulating signal transducer with metallopeptidase domain